MNYYVLSLFPDMIMEAAHTSIMGRAVKNGLISIHPVDIRDYSANKHMRVDDYPYGGGAGMVMEAEPVFRAVEAAKKEAGEGTRVVYLTPQAEVLDQLKVEELSLEKNLILLCGHYEGIDERVLEEVVTDHLSIGDYVLTGGELGALVLMDAVSRFVPGVLSNEESARFESMQDDLLEYPHYTRPEIWHEKEVPAVLLSGDHAKIEEWRHARAIERTKQRRPDLMRQARNVHTIFFGTEKAAWLAEAISRRVSNYGQLLDYNRNKLKKTRRIFAESDFVLFISERPDAEALAAVTARMEAQGSRACILYTGEVKEFADSAEAETIRGILRTAGFVPSAVFFDPEEDLERTALAIRKRCRERAFREKDG